MYIRVFVATDWVCIEYVCIHRRSVPVYRILLGRNGIQYTCLDNLYMRQLRHLYSYLFKPPAMPKCIATHALLLCILLLSFCSKLKKKNVLFGTIRAVQWNETRQINLISALFFSFFLFSIHNFIFCKSFQLFIHENNRNIYNFPFVIQFSFWLDISHSLFAILHSASKVNFSRFVIESICHNVTHRITWAHAPSNNIIFRLLHTHTAHTHSKGICLWYVNTIRC